MKILMLLAISVVYACIANAQRGHVDSSVSKKVQAAVYDTAHLKKENNLLSAGSNQSSSASAGKMKLAPAPTANAKNAAEEDRPEPPPIIYYTPPKPAAAIKQDPPH